MVGLACSFTIVSVMVDAPVWLSIAFGIFSLFSICLFSGVYLYCLVNNPDLLRSEKHTIQKMIVERGFQGDDSTGKIIQQAIEEVKLLEDYTAEDSKE